MNLDDVACRDLVERITDLLDGSMSPAEEAAVLAHVRDCRGCAAAIDQFRRTIHLLGRLPEGEVKALDPEVTDALVAALRARSD